MLVIRYILHNFADIEEQSFQSSIFRKSTLSALDYPHDNSKQSQSTPKDLNHQYLHERVRILCIGDRAS